MTREDSLSLYQELIHCGINLCFWTYDINWDLIKTNSSNKEILDLFFHLNLPAFPEDTSRPLVLTNPVGLLWIADFQKEGQQVGQIHVIGPVFAEDVSVQNLKLNLSKLRLSASVCQEFLSLANEIPVITITRLFEYGLMLHYCITGQHIVISDFQYPLASKPTPQEIEAHKDTHATWAMEQELLKLIEEGNLDYKQQASRLINVGSLANLGNGDTLRHFKNVTIIFTALCTRAAIKGGLQPEIAYSLSDMYIRAIESTRYLGEIIEVNSTMQEDFVHRVHQCRTNPQQSTQIQKCCYYIQTHLYEKITMKELSSYVGHAETYLSRKFKQKMGITITEYICIQKIELAKQLLKSDNTPVSEISERLCFSSQSYFGEQFKKVTGQTPSEYRLSGLS